MTRILQVQRVVMPVGVDSATLLLDGEVVEPVGQFLADLTAIERSPNTIKVCAQSARLLHLLRVRNLDWADIALENVGRFVAGLGHHVLAVITSRAAPAPPPVPDPPPR